MARYKKPKCMTNAEGGAEQTDDEKLAEVFNVMTPKQLQFWRNMNKPGYTQLRAYREAYGTKAPDNSVEVSACKLWNSSKFSLARRLLMNTVREQTLRTREYRIAEMEAFAERAEAAKQYGAAFQARQAIGKLEGHYVDKKEVLSRNSREELELLLDIARGGSDEALAFAKAQAAEIGILAQFEKAYAETMH